MPAQLHQEPAAPAKIQHMPAYIRIQFVRKVYSILSVQLALNVIVGALMYCNIPFEKVQNYTGGAMFASLFSLALLVSVLLCCKNSLKTFPTNFVILFAFTLAESYAVGFACLMYTLPSVMLAVVTTCAVFFCLTAYACFSKKDFTGFGPYLHAALWCMICYATIMCVWGWLAPVPSAMELLYSFFGVVVFSFYIVFDTQRIVEGEHKSFSFEVDDYCLAALTLYLDILNLFLHVLKPL